MPYATPRDPRELIEELRTSRRQIWWSCMGLYAAFQLSFLAYYAYTDAELRSGETWAVASGLAFVAAVWLFLSVVGLWTVDFPDKMDGDW